MKPFEDAIAADPWDAAPHLIYSDWLLENGMDDLAAYHAAWTPKVHAEEWLRAFASKWSFGGYPEEYDDYFGESDRSYVPPSNDDHYKALLDAARTFQAAEQTEWGPVLDNYLTAHGRDLHGADELGAGEHEMFWKCMEVLDDKTYGEEHRSSLGWGCSC